LGNASTQELKHIDTSVKRQCIILGTYQSVLKERKEIWALAVLHVQNLKIMIRATESELQNTLDEIRASTAALRSKAGKIRARNESLATLKASVESKTKDMKNRVDLLTHEQSLLGSHSGLYFDSNIWHEGVTQRMSKSVFARDLQVELASLNVRIASNMQQTRVLDGTLARHVKEGQKVETIVSTLGQIVRLAEKRFDRMAQRTTVQELRAILDEQEFRSDDASVLSGSNKSIVAHTIRNKSSHQRSLEEKQWVALDILINRQLYNALSAVEHEELQLNDEYKTGFSGEDVTRILGLPHEIQLALPHMRSAAELDAHKLLTTYTHGHGEEKFVKADEQSQDNIVFAPSREVSSPTSPSRQNPGPKHIHGPSTGELLPVEPRRVISLVDTMSEVSVKQLGANDEEMAVRTGEREIFRSESTPIRIQESRVHKFEIMNTSPTYFIDLKASRAFTGCMDSRGFNRGRICAVLRRKAGYAEGLVTSKGECVGYAPHARQRVNTGDQFYQAAGTIFIQHCPRRVPLACGTYEVEVAALGPTEYSLVVVAGQCELCTSLVDKRLNEARRLKVRLNDLDGEQSGTWEGVRLRERQYHVCNTLIEEARSECTRCHETIDELCEFLRPRDVGAIIGTMPDSSPTDFDEPSGTASDGSGTRSSISASESTSTESPNSTSVNSSSELSEAERVRTWNEVAAIETEHMHWGRLLTTRCQEKASVKSALQCLMKLLRDGRAEKSRLEGQLEQMSAEIRIVLEAMHGSNAAAEILRELTSSSANGNNRNSISTRGRCSKDMIYLETPAGKTRQAFRRGGLGALTLEEQQWITVDQSICPDRYEWLKHQEKECRSASERPVKRSKRPTNPTLEHYRFHPEELRRMLAKPSQDLNRKEVHVRKLLHKFHDDPQLVGTDTPTACAETHHTSLAERTRLKQHHRRTAMEKEWISVDRILNPTA
ncbi:unnamed protein product, partial [Hapterophycus canaliculatus]